MSPVCGIFFLYILKYENIFEVGSVQSLGRKLGGDRAKQPNLLLLFCPLVYIIFCSWFEIKVGHWDSILVAIDIHINDSNCDVKKTRRRLDGAERVGRQITLEVRWDQPTLFHLHPTRPTRTIKSTTVDSETK